MFDDRFVNYKVLLGDAYTHMESLYGGTWGSWKKVPNTRKKCWWDVFEVIKFMTFTYTPSSIGTLKKSKICPFNFMTFTY